MNVTTINVRGLNNPIKRQTLFQWLKAKPFNIICLQETYCTTESVQSISDSWDGASYHCTTNSSHSRGVSILISNAFEHKLINKHECPDGRCLLINIEHSGQTYTIANLYSPTDVTSRKHFLTLSKKWIRDRSENINCLIVCGDFNCSLASIDRKVQNSDASRPIFRDFLAYLDLNDAFRISNINKVAYTYSNKTGSIQSRIDYVLMTHYLTDKIKKCYILKPPKVPDHHAVVCHLRSDVKCGTGYWKMNCKLLDDLQYIEHIKSVITNVKKDFSNILDKRRLWDFCKVRIKEESIKWSQKCTKQHKEQIKVIEKELAETENDIARSSEPEILTKLNIKREDLILKHNSFYHLKAKGAQIRSRAKWVEQGEKNTKYFLTLENKRQTNNIISCITNNKGKKLYNPKDFLDEGHYFYQTLCKI